MKFPHISVKKAILILVILAVIAAIASLALLNKGAKVEYITENITRGKLIQTVSETGTVKAAQEIDLNFGNSGKINKILVSIGDQVAVGQVLAELDFNALAINKDEAEANFAIVELELAKLLAGATREEIAVKEAGVNQALENYQAAKREYQRTNTVEEENIKQAEKELADLTSNSSTNITTYEQAVVTAQNSLDNAKKTYQRSIDNYTASGLDTADAKLAVADTALDSINTILSDDDVKLILSSQNTQYKNLTEVTHGNANSLKVSAYVLLSTAKNITNSENVLSLLENTLATLNKTLDALNYCYDALENTFTSGNFTQTELDAYKTSIDTEITSVAAAVTSTQTANQNLSDAILNYDTNILTAQNSLADAKAKLNNAILTANNKLNLARLTAEQRITAAESKVNTTKEAWELAQAQLNQTKAPARPQDVNLAQAKVKQAQSAISSIKQKIEDSFIKAPMEGTITKVEYEVGEQTALNNPVFSMLGENNYEIEVDISEADIAKVGIDNPATITLDAYGDDIEFKGQLYFIEPAETIIQDVIYYKVSINFDPGSYEVKSGMTANITITTAEKDNILLITSRGIIEKNGGTKYTRILANNQLKEVPITVGLRGDEGMTEVISGVNEGDTVVTSVNEKK